MLFIPIAHILYCGAGGMSVCKGELACLLGTSGCGKTTVLRAVAGFERLNKGKFLYHSIVY